MMLADVCAEVLAHIVDPAQAKLGILPGLSSEALERAWPSDKRWRQLEVWMRHVLLSNSSQTHHIVTIGGSVTAGQFSCGGSRNYTPPFEINGSMYKAWSKCRWPARLQAWLQETFPRNGRFEVTNLAEAGWSTLSWAVDVNVPSHKTSMLHTADLVLTELVINSEPSEVAEKRSVAAVWSSLLAMPSQPAVMALELPNVGITPFDDLDRDLLKRSCYETESDHVRLHANSSPISTHSADYALCRRYWAPATWHSSILTALDIPSISLHQALWPTADKPSPEIASFWVDAYDPHPGWRTHTRLAHTVAHALIGAARKVCTVGDVPLGRTATVRLTRETLPPNDTLGLIAQQCKSPLTRLDGHFLPATNPRGWAFGEDVPGNRKPGWHANATGRFRGSHYVIEFDVVVGSRRLLILSRLSSYDMSMGKVRIDMWRNGSAAVHGSKRRWFTVGEVDGYWPVHSSMVRPAFVVLPTNFTLGAYRVRIQLVGSPLERLKTPPDRSTLWVRAASRFKLLSLISC